MQRRLEFYLRPMCVLACALNAHCGALPRTTDTAAEGRAAEFTSRQLYQIYASADASQRKAAAAVAGAMPVMNFYELTLASSLDTAVSFDGFKIKNQATQLRQSAWAYEALAAVYPTMGDYWRAVGYDAAAKMTEADFLRRLGAALAEAAAPAAGIGLVDLRELPQHGCSVWDATAPIKVAPTSGLPAGALYPTELTVDAKGNITAYQKANQPMSDASGPWYGISSYAEPPLLTQDAAYARAYLSEVNSILASGSLHGFVFGTVIQNKSLPGRSTLIKSKTPDGFIHCELKASDGMNFYVSYSPDGVVSSYQYDRWAL